MQFAYNDKTVYCIGSNDEYTSLLCCKSIETINKLSFEYLGERLVGLDCIPQRVLLLNLNIDNISICIKKRIEFIAFFYEKHIITDENYMTALSILENQNPDVTDYCLIKQINIIRLVFDIRKESVVLTSKPVHLQIEHTTFCNARCVMCDHYIAHNRGAKHLKLSTLKVLESLFPYVTTVIMHGNGEVLLNPEILQIFELYKKYQIKTSLNTNLSYLSDELLNAMRENCTSIHVSCDGCNKEQYESIRQGLSYSNFLFNMARLSKTCPDTEKVLEVVIMRQNIRNTEEFISLGYQYGFHKVIFNALGCNEWIGNEKDSPYNYAHTAFYYCQKAKEHGKRLGIQVITPFDELCDADNDLLDINSIGCQIGDSDSLHEKYPWYTNTIAVQKLTLTDLLKDGTSTKNCSFEGVCEYPFAKSYIDLNGRVSFCCPASRKIVDTVTWGKSFEMIWNGAEYQKLRESFYHGNLPNMCEGCYFIRNKSLKFFLMNRRKVDKNE